MPRAAPTTAQESPAARASATAWRRSRSASARAWFAAMMARKGVASRASTVLGSSWSSHCSASSWAGRVSCLGTVMGSPEEVEELRPHPVGVDDAGRLVDGDGDELEERAVAGRTENEEPGLLVVLLRDDPEGVL